MVAVAECGLTVRADGYVVFCTLVLAQRPSQLRVVVCVAGAA